MTTEKSQREGRSHNNSSGRKSEAGQRPRDEIVGSTDKEKSKKKVEAFETKTGETSPIEESGRVKELVDKILLVGDSTRIT